MLATLDRAVETLLGLTGVALVATAFAQVVARYAFSSPFTWVLELDVLLMVWATMLAGYLGVRRNTHMAVDLVLAKVGAAARRRVALVNQLLCIAFVALCAWNSAAVIDSMSGMYLTSIPIGQPVLYWSVPVGCILMLVALARGLADILLEGT